LNEIKDRIDESNKAAAGNRSKYPIQEQATLIELWEQSDCECGPECFCKKYGCTFHWKIKPNLDVDEVIAGFVRTYIDVEKHATFFKYLNDENQNENQKLSPRIKEAVKIAKDLKNNWDTYYSNALESKSCILCNNHATEYWLKKFRDKTIDKSIYNFKMWSILLPDIAVPFDIKARESIKRELGLKADERYSTLIRKLRDLYQNILEKSNAKIDDLRMLDEPGKYLDFVSQDVRLGKLDEYPKVFLPLQRPFCRVLDKVFYRPDGKTYSGTTSLMNHYAVQNEYEVEEKKEKQIRQVGGRVFNYNRIKGKANADKLFVYFLRKIEEGYSGNLPNSFTIEEIVKRIPKEVVEILNNSSYNYALIALFGSQKGRDYFLFENISIQNQFTNEANNTLRNNYFWKNFLKTRVSINPNYLLKCFK